MLRLSGVFILGFLFVSFTGYSQMWFPADYEDGFLPKEYDSAATDASWLKRKLFHEDFIALDKEGLQLTINPLMNLAAGQSSLKDNLIYRNTRGVGLEGKLGNSVVFNTSFYETQQNAPVWIDNYYRKFGVLPGETNAKGYGDDGYDNGSVYGSFGVNQQLGKWKMQLRLGYDNLFIGESNRSLFLSDYSLPYYFGGLHIKKNRFDYLHLTTSTQNPNFRNVLDLETTGRPSTAPYQKKTISVHYLRYQLTDFIRMGLFEATVYQVADSSERKFSMQYVNPVILTNALAYGLDGSNNVLLGLDFLLTFNRSFQAYFQMVADNTEKEGLGFLSSLQYRTTRFKLTGEWSETGSAVMTHADPRQSFSHYNQPLGHAAGAGTQELLFETGYRINRAEVEARYIHQRKDVGLDYRLLPASELTQRTTHEFYQFTARYIVNPATRLQVFGDIILYNNTGQESETYFRFGIKTQLRREYISATAE